VREANPDDKEFSFEKEDIKVDMFKDYKLYDLLEPIQDITNRAEKKSLLAKKLKEMKETMKKTIIQQLKYKDTYLLKALDEKDGVNETLDDQIVNT